MFGDGRDKRAPYLTASLDDQGQVISGDGLTDNLAAYWESKRRIRPPSTMPSPSSKLKTGSVMAPLPSRPSRRQTCAIGPLDKRAALQAFMDGRRQTIFGTHWTRPYTRYGGPYHEGKLLSTKQPPISVAYVGLCQDPASRVDPTPTPCPAPWCS